MLGWASQGIRFHHYWTNHYVILSFLVYKHEKYNESTIYSKGLENQAFIVEWVNQSIQLRSHVKIKI